MKRLLIVLALFGLNVNTVARAEEAPESGMERSADMLLVGIPVVALGLTFVLDGVQDASGGNAFRGYDVLRMSGTPRHDLSLALLRTGAVTYGLKYAVDEERPNGEGGSFPSGHTSITFAGAEFIRKQYGWGWGAPAFAAATFVGYSRVATDDHWWHDVAAGAAIGILSNHDFSEISGRWGSLQMAPALMRSPSPLGLGSAQEVPSAAPGLKLEFRF